MLKGISFLPCAFPPSIQQLTDIIVTMIENDGTYESKEQETRWKRLAQFMRKNSPEKQWMLGLLAKISPNHEIF